MPKYQATFSDGTTITRNAHRVYSHAYRVSFEHPVDGRPCGTIGFAGSYDLAEKAAKGFLPPLRRRRVFDDQQDRAGMQRDQAAARDKALATRKIEIVKALPL